MEYRALGSTDITVSALGIGCYDASGWPSGFDEMGAAVDRAIDLGITCFDTAPNYGGGESEIMLGKVLGPRRKDAVVVTKCGLGWQGSQVGRERGRDGRRESILPLVDQSLQRMQTDYIDVLLVHFPDKHTPIDETMGALETVVQQGKVRSVGVSNFSLDGLKECEKTLRIDVVQYHYNAFDRRMEDEILPYCREKGIGFMAWGPLGNGLLAGTYTAQKNFRETDWRGKGDVGEIIIGMYADEVWERNISLVDDLKSIAAGLGKTLPQLVLRWVLDNPTVSIAIPGILNVTELEDDLGALDWALSGEDLRQIDQVFASHGIDTSPPQLMDP